MATTQTELATAGWVRLTSNVWERSGKGGVYTLLLGSNGLHTIINPIGKRAVRVAS